MPADACFIVRHLMKSTWLHSMLLHAAASTGSQQAYSMAASQVFKLQPHFHFLPTSSHSVLPLSSWWQYLCILLISAWNSVLDSLVSAPHIHAHSTWFISSHTTHSLLCLLSGSSTSMQPHKNRNWVSLLTSALPASKTQILEAPCLSVEWINQLI